MAIEFFHPMLLMVKLAFVYLFILAAGCAAGTFITLGLIRKKQALENKSRFWLEDLDRTISPMVFTDLECKIYYANRAFLSLWGYLNINEAAGKNFTELWQNKEKALKIQEKALDVDEWKGELTGQKKDGNFFEVQLSINKIKNNNGNPIYLIIAFNDITEQKKAKNILAKEYNLLRTVVDSLPDKIFIKDTQGAFLFCNSAVTKSFNALNSDEIIGKTDFDFIPHDRAIRYQEQEREIVRTGQSMINQEFFVKDEYGNIIKRFSSTKIPWKDHHGHIIGLIGINHDMTALDKAEEALAREHNLLKSIVDTLPDLIYVKNRDSEFVFANEVTSTTLKFKSPDELIGKTDFDLLPEDRAEKYKQEEQKVMTTGQPLINRQTTVSRNGEDRTYVVTKVPWRDGTNNVIGIIGINHDITELTRAKEDLAKEHNLLKSLVENLPDYIYVKNKNSEFVFVNQLVAAHHGFKSVDELIGKTDFDIVPEPYAGQYLKEEQDIMKTGEPVINREGKDLFEQNRFFIITKVPWRDKNNNIIGIIGINHDISVIKRAEEALQKAHDELESRVKERTYQLAKANDELTNEITERKKIEEQLLSYQNQLRTLASELSITEETLRRKIAIDIHDGIGQNLAISKIKIESIKHMLDNPEVVNSIKEISNIISQTIDITRTLTFEISPPVLYELGFDAALDWLVNNMRQRHKIDAEYVNDSLHKPLDNKMSVLLFGAVRELLVNIVKHAKANHVQVTNQRIGDEISIKVSDDGVGFNSNILSSHYAYGRFGLFSIKERLGYIGGNVKIESTPNQGTLITLTAPLDNAMLNKKKDK